MAQLKAHATEDVTARSVRSTGSGEAVVTQSDTASPAVHKRNEKQIET